MTITELLPIRGRKQVSWFLQAPPQHARSAFEDREFLVTQCDRADLRKSSYLAGLSAVVFTQNPTKLRGVVGALETFAKTLLDHGCGVIVRPSTGQKCNGTPLITDFVGRLHIPAFGLPLIAGQRDESPLLPHVRVYGENVPWADIANFIAQHPPDRSPAPDGELTVVVKDEGGQRTTLDSSGDLLVRRAFADCKEVVLVQMPGGRSHGVSVFKAHATLGTGGYPLSYFVKLGSRAKIVTEYQNYKEMVRPYVPFYLGPHLASERCCLGMDQAVIVGDYVEESEGLGDCASAGRAAPAIACLFERTLRGWHRSAEEDGRSLVKILGPRFPSAIAADRLSLAKTLGANQDLTELRKLFDRCNTAPVLVGPSHGDLHAGNVRVRTTDAIVIDFGEHDHHPLLCDAASLEASLLVDGFAKVGLWDGAAWLTSIKALYDCSLLDRALPYPNPTNPSYWFHACVRQIRLYASQMERGPNQYAGALAFALLKKAEKDKDVPSPEAYRRAAAYALAERVLSIHFR